MKKFFSILCFFLLAFGITSCGIISVVPNETSNYYAFSITINGNGSVNSLGNNRYKNGTVIDLEANPDRGYLFTGFFEDDVLLSTEATYSITSNKDTNLIAIFVQEENEQPEEYQGNRNLFIDYPELANFIWGNNEYSILSIVTINQDLEICDMVLLEQTIKNYYDIM